MGMALRAVAQNGYFFVLDQVDVAITVILNAHILGPFVCLGKIGRDINTVDRVLNVVLLS